MKLDIKLLRHRVLQSTESLMAEVGGAIKVHGTQFAYRDNGAPVLGVAHCDYVDQGSNHFLAKNGKVWSSRLDDRLGVYVLLDVLPALGINVDVLLTDDEESGQSSAQHFDTTKQFNWLFQFDRRGTDAVCYGYTEMEPSVGEHFAVGAGSFSDICWLDHLGVCGVNIGTAYYNEHSLGSYADLDQLAQQVNRFARFYRRFSKERIGHTPIVSGRNPWNTPMRVGDLCDACGWECEPLEMFDFEGGKVCKWCHGEIAGDIDREYRDIVDTPWKLVD